MSGIQLLKIIHVFAHVSSSFNFIAKYYTIYKLNIPHLV